MLTLAHPIDVAPQGGLQKFLEAMTHTSTGSTGFYRFLPVLPVLPVINLTGVRNTTV